MTQSDREAAMDLKGRNILLGICGSIAAYKSVYLCRLLVKAGADVRVLMTPAATGFVSPVTFTTLSRNPVHLNISDENQWNDHVEWGLWADILVIAPATATTMAKMASGIADNMLLATFLSARCKCAIAPAMDLDMWKHPSTRRNLDILLSDGVELIDVGEGELASGLEGPGRMAEPESIFRQIALLLKSENTFAGKRILITAGPTLEKIDPVRFISNHSSGRMGVALAEAFARKGADVDLVHGPIRVSPNHPAIHSHPVESADEMASVCEQLHPNCQIAVFAAAVSDYRPENTSDSKIKKDKSDKMTLVLKKNPDIAANCGKRKKKGQFHLGFALETESEVENAQKKLKAKNFDLIALNSLADEGAGFGHLTNKVTLIAQNKTVELELKPKVQIAEDIVNYIARIHDSHDK